MICPNCGTNNADGCAFCANCGFALSNNQIPNNINQDVQTNQVQVETAPINNEQFMQTPQVQQPSQNNFFKDKKNIIIIAVVCLVVLVGGYFGFKAIFKSSTGDNKLDALLNDDIPIMVKKDGKYGYINTNGDVVIDINLAVATDFIGNYAIVGKESGENFLSRKYYVINNKGEEMLSASFASDINHEDDYDIWIVDDKLYDNNLKQLSQDNVKVDYEDYGYLSWINKEAKTAGIMDTTGKVIYTTNLNSDETFVSVYPSYIDKSLKERYCIFNIENERFAIVNCDNGKVVYDYTTDHISKDDNNLFEISTNGDYQFIKEIYVGNDKIMHETSDENVEMTYNSDGYVRIYDKNKSYPDCYSYLDLSTGNISSEVPRSTVTNDIDIIDEVESLSGIKKFYNNGHFGIKKGDQIVIESEWNNIIYFDVSLHKYLKTQGKEYVMARKDDKTYILDLNSGKQVAEFNSKSIIDSSRSPFVYYKDGNNAVIYGLLNGKTLSTSSENSIYLRSNYFAIRENNKLDYYNKDFKHIFTGDKI